MLNRLMMVAPSGSNTWVSTFNGTIVSEAVDAAGNSYIAGSSNAPSSPCIIKISPEGTVLFAYAIPSDLQYSQVRICLNSSGTEFYVVAPQYSYIGNAFYVARFSATGTLLGQKLFKDNSNFGSPYVWGAVANNTFLYVSMEGYYNSTTFAKGIFKIDISTLTISSKRSYTSTGRLKSLTLNSAGTALYVTAGTNTYGLVFMKIDTSNLAVFHSTYISFPQTQQLDTIYGLALDSTETNVSIVGRGYFTFSGFTQNWPLLFSVKADASSINWNIMARSSASTYGYVDVQIDASGNTYAAGDHYDGTIWKKQLLKVSPSSTILFSNAFDGANYGDADYNSLVICNANSTIKYGFRGTAASGQAFHSLPIDGSATGTYVVGSDTYTYASFTPTYYTLSPYLGSAGINIVSSFTNYGTATVSYTFPSITVTLPKKDIP